MALRLPRIIPRLAIKGENVVCTVNCEGLRVVGKPEELARKYAEDADEIFYLDTVASLYGRNQLTELLSRTCEDVFIPITVGGGVKSRADVKRLLDAGADKVAINTAAVRAPRLIRECADYYGSQAIVLNIEARRTEGGWEALTDAGRERTGKDAQAWAAQAVALGAGEILLTSVDQEGTRRGFDAQLLEAIAQEVRVPVTICGGMGSLEHLEAVAGVADGVAMASVLHYGALTVQDMREALGQADRMRRQPRAWGQA